MYFLIASLAYLFVGGLVAAVFYNRALNDCRQCRGPGYCRTDHQFNSFMFGLTWVVIGPVLLGAWAGNGLSDGSRADRRRAKELEEARHQTELAKIRAEETELLEKALR